MIDSVACVLCNGLAVLQGSLVVLYLIVSVKGVI